MDTAEDRISMSHRRTRSRKVHYVEVNVKSKWRILQYVRDKERGILLSNSLDIARHHRLDNEIFVRLIGYPNDVHADAWHHATDAISGGFPRRKTL